VVAVSTLVANLMVTLGSSQTADPSEVAAAAVANVAADSVGVVGALLRRRSAPTFLSEVGRLVAPA